MATPKRHKPTIDYLVYLAVRVLVGIVQALPIRWALAFADVFAALIYRVDKRHRKVAAENLRFAFPEKSEAEVDRLVRGCYRQFCTLLFEIILLPRKLRMTNWRTSTDMVNSHAVVSGLMRDRPMLIVTAHLGNWELAGYYLGALGFRTYAIARVLDNPYLEDFLKRFRQGTGQTVIAKKDDFDRLEAVLRAGGKVATLADQDAGPRGVFVDFFGRPASAHKAVALMAMEFQTTMVVVGVVRRTTLNRGQIGPYDIICEDAIDPAEYAGRPDAVKAITQRYHDAIARLIRRSPEQYFWLHRRWKSQPAVKKSAMKQAA
ncbi:lysophospholipid acyltransferase family protein [Limnoglobus roseus]|uniref:Lipid A biosynthesis acyltransferase n=1 Tax=Limnoglobus roseus TaxID=2598579 RepID=A0A5C1A5I8_9BACT|nr:lipid A biosynthesis acyltransferase [Limnoglobus roseus]QEL13595.1 lipid A biosynthesis acyltransferase [Limnoglobus roseus]